MPNLEKNSLNLSEARKNAAGSSADSASTTKGATKLSPTSRKAGASSRPQPRPRPASSLFSEDEDDDLNGTEVGVGDDDDDEIIASSLDSKKKGKQLTVKQIAGAVGVVLLVVVVFTLFILNNKKEEPQPSSPTTYDSPGTSTPVTTQTPAPDSEYIPPDNSLGLQDFTQNTNMNSDSPLSDPSDFTKDIHDLTLRVNYEVKSIMSAADMVSYTKRRGTWGGGLELYWLEVVYQEKQYVIQVPFAYYKELSDTGIVPVKMEILRIASETDGEYLTIISYMELDEATLKQIMRTQSRN